MAANKTDSREKAKRAIEAQASRTKIGGLPADAFSKAMFNPRTGSGQYEKPAAPSGPAAPAAPGYAELSQSQLTAGYQQFINDQNKQFDRFTKDQRANIAAIQQRNTNSINSQLGAIESGAASSYSNFSNTLNAQLNQSKATNQAYRTQFANENAQSEANIGQYQSQIQGISAATKVDPLTTGPETVSGWDSLGKIGIDQGAIRLNRGTTRTGSNTNQQQSRARQKVGLQGLRRGS